MLKNIHYLPFLSPDADASASTTTTEAPSSNNGERGDDKEALRRMGEQRDAARTEAKAAKDERDALLAEKADREAEEQKRKDQEAAESGKWEELATKRDAELKDIKSQLSQFKEENDQLRAAMNEGLEARLKGLPDKVKKVLEDTVEETNVLARWKWLHKPSVQALIEEESAEAPNTRRDPKPGGSVTRTVEEEARLINRAGQYVM